MTITPPEQQKGWHAKIAGIFNTFILNVFCELGVTPSRALREKIRNRLSHITLFRRLPPTFMLEIVLALFHAGRPTEGAGQYAKHAKYP